MEIKKIKISQIIADENQPRKKFDENQIKELAQSIEKYGLLQPIILKKSGDKYKIIAGERRYRACKLLNLDFAESIIKDDVNTKEIALIENIQRENLTPLEEALAINELKVQKNYTHEELALMLGKTRVYITNKLRILSADDNTKNLLKEGKISEGHARALLAEKDIIQRKKLAQKIISEGLSVRDIEKELKNKKNYNNENISLNSNDKFEDENQKYLDFNYNSDRDEVTNYNKNINSSTNSKYLQNTNLDYRENQNSFNNNSKNIENQRNQEQNSEEINGIIELLEDVLSTKIKIEDNDSEKGSIVIDYYSKKQLEDIVQKIIEK